MTSAVGHDERAAASASGPGDARVQYTCTPGGNVAAITGCPFPTFIPPAGDPAGNSVVVTVTFTTGAPGTGSVQLTATPTDPPGSTGGGGAWAFPFQMSPGQQACPNPGTTEQLFQWPRMRSAYDQNRGNVFFSAWLAPVRRAHRASGALGLPLERPVPPGAQG